MLIYVSVDKILLISRFERLNWFLVDEREKNMPAEKEILLKK
jgi:hypothetical protein